MLGEGDIMRHLASNGYRLFYEQDPRAELAFGVENLAIDLRDGLRLCRLVEVLSGKHLHGRVMTCIVKAGPDEQDKY